MKGATYTQLLNFHAIVEQGSIRGAARTLEMAPPSVSQALKLLEANIGLTLFNRSTRKMELTDAGQMLYDTTIDAMASLESALEGVTELSEVPKGLVRITLPRFVYQVYFRPIYAEFCRRYPQIQLEVSVSDAAVDIVKQGFDLGIRLGDRIEAGMVAKQLTPPMAGALFASADYLQRNGTPETIEELRQHHYIQYRFITSNQFAPLELMEKGERIKVEMPTAMVVNDTELVVSAAEEGLGIGSLVVPCVEPSFKSGELIPLLQEHWATYPGLHLYFVQNSQKIRRVRVLIDYLIEKLGQKPLR